MPSSRGRTSSTSLPFPSSPILAEVPLEDWGTYRNRFKVGGVKVTIDGSPQGRTAYFTTLYLRGGPAGETDWRGELTFPQDEVGAMVKRVYDMGIR